ncbi:MerR family transcriptional regulator [Tenggerimyces flavus]|uniref:MerR family transcriptional regulator n=1 Tax=Tenggerimyces flavus TaxID=1708749 RepID=A0ABV7YSW2_9ACTN|nr:MerR family transcriptional regulator [Tenggerimyces flavus]MBM7790134.1 DNA-binding transcriptional MerR regulator [Tenggerimyces flavus]
MTALLSIGEFARVSHVSVKALRHYDEIGQLKPANVDPWWGRRRYSSAQVPAAQVIRRFRELDMSLDQIQLVLDAPDIDSRNEVIVRHLQRMQQTLEHTQAAVESLKSLLEGRSAALSVECRRVEAVSALAITGNVEWDDIERWLESAFGELHHLWTTSILRSSVVLTLPCTARSSSRPTRGTGRRVPSDHKKRDPAGRAEIEIPAAPIAVAVHKGPFAEVDQAYAALGTFVTERVLGSPGPIRENDHVVGGDEPSIKIEFCWPIRHLPKEPHS